MEFKIDKKKMIKVGTPIVMESASSTNNKFKVVFEDNGDTGYFYALETDTAEVIQDAVHIYNAKDVLDRHKPSEFAILWCSDGLKAFLLINTYPHAVIDFERKRAYCKTGFPSNNKNGVWSTSGHNWDEKDFRRLINK